MDPQKSILPTHESGSRRCAVSASPPPPPARLRLARPPVRAAAGPPPQAPNANPLDLVLYVVRVPSLPSPNASPSVSELDSSASPQANLCSASYTEEPSRSAPAAKDHHTLPVSCHTALGSTQLARTCNCSPNLLAPHRWRLSAQSARGKYAEAAQPDPDGDTQ